MIRSIRIKNFQAHKDLSIEFGPHVNSIVGPSDAGKSAILRALRWVITNKPAGFAFIRDGAKKAEVSVVAEIDPEVAPITVTRSRSKSVNTYHVGSKELKAFGNDVPEKVAEVFNLADINFQGQHDSPYWFNDTAGEVSRQLNRIVDLEIIDRTLSYLDKEHRDAMTKVKVVESQKETAVEERKALRWARKADKALAKVEEMGRDRAQVADACARLADLCETIAEGGRQIKRQRAKVSALERLWELGEEARHNAAKVQHLAFSIEYIEGQHQILDRGRPDTKLLRDMLRDATVLRQRRLRIAALVEEADEAQEQIRPIPDFTELDTLFNAAKAAFNERHKLEGVVGLIEVNRHHHQHACVVAAASEEQFKEQLGDVCPLCGAEQ